MQYINIKSEIGKLNRVMLHCPSIELEALTPATLRELLFDDIPFLKMAIKEHGHFANVLKENGVEVHYLEGYLFDIFADKKIRDEFALDYINRHTTCEVAKDYLLKYLSSISLEEFIISIFAGIRKNQIKGYTPRTLSELMKEHDSPFWTYPLPNLYFTRDPTACIGDGLTIHRMRKKARQLETLFMSYIHRYHPAFHGVPLLYNRNIQHPIEGGDIVVLSDKVVAVGCGERSSPEGIELLAKNILTHSKNIKKILAFKIPKNRAYMHLDTVFTMVDYDKFTIFASEIMTISVYQLTMDDHGTIQIDYKSDLLDKILAAELDIPKVTLVKCGGGEDIISQREQWNDGSNTLAIAPGVVIVYDRNYVTNKLLHNYGIKTIEIHGSELSRGRGGPRCMSMPLHRDDL